MPAIEERLREVDAAMAALGVSAERIEEIRARIRSQRRSRADEDALLAGLDIDLPAPAPPRASRSPGIPSIPALSEESLFGDAIPDAPMMSPFDDLGLSEPPRAVTPDSSDLASLLEGDDDVMIVGSGGMALSFDEEPASPAPAATAGDEFLEIENTEVEVLEPDDFELLVDESALEGARPLEPASGEGDDPEGDDGGEGGEGGEKKGFFRKLFR